MLRLELLKKLPMLPIFLLVVLKKWLKTLNQETKMELLKKQSQPKKKLKKLLPNTIVIYVINLFKHLRV